MFGVYIYGGYTTQQLYGDLKINHFNRDPWIKQPVFNGKFFDVFFFVAQKKSESLESSKKTNKNGPLNETRSFQLGFFCCLRFTPSKKVTPGSPWNLPGFVGMSWGMETPSFSRHGWWKSGFMPRVFREKIPQEAAGSCRRNGRSSMLPHNCCPETLERCLISWEQISKSF